LLLEVSVLKSFTNVNAAETFRVAFVEGSISVPDVVADDCCLARAVLLDAPHSARLVSIKSIEEVTLEDSIVLKECLGLDFALHISEVRVPLYVAELFFWESLECGVSVNFVRLSQSHGALGNNMAVVLNGEHGVEKSVDFL
jgi:hypothetical protein